MKVRANCTWIALTLGLTIILCSAVYSQETASIQSSDDSNHPWVVLASGGGVRTIGDLTVGITIGQGCAGTLNLSSHTAHIGFWQNFGSGCCIGIRGNIDASADNVIDILDLTYLVQYMFKDGNPPFCMDEADVNGVPAPVDILDLTYLVAYMFKDGPDPADCP